jgi:hypothetical protein
MKNSVLKSVVLALAVLALGVGIASADVTVTVNQADLTLGFMNVFTLGNAYEWGQPWGTLDLTATWAPGNIVTLGPNCVNDPNPYWYLPSGGPGAAGQHLMEANLYTEVNGGSLAGQNVTFQGCVISNTLTSAHVSVAFVKDFAADYSSFNWAYVALPASGPFSVTLATVPDPSRHVQWGFQTKGVNVWITDLAPYGTAVVGPASGCVVPAKSQTWGALKSLYR